MVMTRGGSRSVEEREEPEKKPKTRGRSRSVEEREEPEKKPKLSPMTTRSGSRTGEEREMPGKLSTKGRGRSRTGELREEPAKKTKLIMDPIVSVDSSTKGASERIPRTVVCFRYSPHPEFHRFRHKLAEFGRILTGPCNLPFLHDFAYLQYSAQDAADKALRQPVQIPRLGVELICHNIDHTALDAVRQAAYNLVEPHVLPHPSNTLVYVTNVHYEATLDQIGAFFSRFGEIAEGPFWFEMEPESEFGFTLLVYKTEEGAKVAVQQPYKHFGGHQVHCSHNLDAITQYYQGMFVDYLDEFAQFHTRQQSRSLQQPPPLAGACI